MKPKLVIAGGSGFLGTALARHFAARDSEVIILTRTPAPAAGRIKSIPWDGRTLGGWCKELEGARALINLAGLSVDCRYHRTNRRRLLESRLEPTRVLGEALSRCQTPPPVWLNASTATLYQHTYGPAWDENGVIAASPEAKDTFSVHLAEEWERVFYEAVTPRTRKVALRSAMVLGHGKNSVLPTLLLLTRLGLGGSLAGGKQYVSWIHEEDFCRAVDWTIDHDSVSGPVNIAAPHPLTNGQLMATLRRLCGMRFGLPAPLGLLEIGAFVLRTETELIIKSRRVIPGKLLAAGFRFQHPQAQEAIEHLIHSGPVPNS